MKGEHKNHEKLSRNKDTELESRIERLKIKYQNTFFLSNIFQQQTNNQLEELIFFLAKAEVKSFLLRHGPGRPAKTTQH